MGGFHTTISLSCNCSSLSPTYTAQDASLSTSTTTRDVAPGDSEDTRLGAVTAHQRGQSFGAGAAGTAWTWWCTLVAVVWISSSFFEEEVGRFLGASQKIIRIEIHIGVLLEQLRLQ